MLNQFITKLKTTAVYFYLRRFLYTRAENKQLEAWIADEEKGAPPHIVKQRTIKNAQREYGLKVLVETGTYYGDMDYAMRDVFEKIYSIELSKDLHKQAVKRFAKFPNMTFVQGDSATELKNIVAQLNQPALFWLDGHYSAGVTALGKTVTPIFEELENIFASGQKGHVLLIDDARLFGNDTGYPSLDALYAFITERFPKATFSIKDDSIKVVLD
jgi:hypothetical protein